MESSANQFPAVKTKLSIGVLAAVAVFAAGCSTVDSRIAKNREAFNSWPPAVQDKVVVGQIDLGFTTDQVAVALGQPDRVFTRTTADGTSQVWTYRDRGPRFSFGVGVGMGSFGGRGGSFGGVGINTGGGYHDDEKMGIVFDPNGRVSSIETRQK
jgi:hypothetical protein